MGVVRSSELPIDRSDAGVDALRIVNRAMGAKHITGGVAKFSPGSAIILHTHPCEEMVTIIEGVATCELNGKRFVLQPYDTSFVEAGVPHRFINESDKRMTIICFYPGTDVARDPVGPE